MTATTRRMLKVSTNFLPLPIFLCPAVETVWNMPRARIVCSPMFQKRQLHVEAAAAPAQRSLPSIVQLNGLPWSCPGCGAFTQTSTPYHPGFYTITRKSVKAFVAQHGDVFSNTNPGESQVFNDVLNQADQSLLQNLGLADTSTTPREKETTEKKSTPICDRCHDLLHHHHGVSIGHPTLRSIQDIISESPYKYNHIYHILDAADFPLSLIPQLQRQLSLMPQRSLNRRAKTGKFYHGRKAEMSFIITRSDLLAPNKEQVDSLMPYLLRVLRDALGSSGRDVRLGNVRCVSSKRGWWTKQIKEDIWNRGGGGWMVGKVNVGKSNLFECVFPKGRNEDVNFESLRHGTERMVTLEDRNSNASLRDPYDFQDHDQRITPIVDKEYNEDYGPSEILSLPPAPLETAFPMMPVVSSLPGTTASAIRLPFGGGKGELVDLPGLSRGNLDDHVNESHKLDLVMRHRVKPEQKVIKPGQSLLLGGLIRITPTTPDVVMLAYPFIPMESHVTSNEKAIAIHTQQELFNVPSITQIGAGEKMASAGIFKLKWDVTKQRAGPLTSSAAVGLNTRVLPFVVLSTDILIEGCGWVELVVQVRKKQLESMSAKGDDKDYIEGSPAVEIYSPNGEHIGARRPMGGWILGGPKHVPRSKRTVRPRRSMKGVKKRLKLAKRMTRANSTVK